VPAVIRILGQIGPTDGDSVELDFNDTNFQLQGNSTKAPTVTATDSLSDSPAGDVEVNMQWSISLDGGSKFTQVATNLQVAFVTWDFAHGYDTVNAVSTNSGITARRIQRSAAINALQYDITSLATFTATSLSTNPGFSPNVSVDANLGGHPWVVLDNGTACDCYSLAELSTSILQMIGVSSAKAERAYPTGGIPPGNTDTTSPETDASGRILNYMDGFFSSGQEIPNNYEGFFEVTDQGSREGYTVAPLQGPLSAYSGSVSGDPLFFNMIRNTLQKARSTTSPHQGRQYWNSPTTGVDFNVEVPFPTLP